MAMMGSMAHRVGWMMNHALCVDVPQATTPRGSRWIGYLPLED